MNRRFTTLSIRHKLMAVALFITIIGPVLSAVAFIGYDLFRIRNEIAAEAGILAEVTGKAAEAVFNPNDLTAAARIRALMRANPSVRKACLLDLQDRPVATYFRDAADNSCEYKPYGKRFILRGSFMDVVQPVQVDGEVKGTLVIRYELRGVAARLKGDVVVGVVILAVTAIIILLTAIPFQNTISATIGHAAETAAKIIREKDYFSRIDNNSRDEIGMMVDSFNTLLGMIQERDIILARQNRKMEEKVATLRQELRNVTVEAEREKARLKKKIGNARQMVDQAEAANRYKSQFLANMSHEIRTPLNAILGFAQILEDRVSGEAEQQHLKSITASGNTLLELINEILDLSKIEAGKLELNYYRVDLTHLLNDIHRIFAKEIKDKNLQFFLEIDAALPPGLWLDGARLRQVLINLIGNAIKFTAQGYIRIRVNTDRKSADVAGDRLNLTISVEDTGIGIAASQQEAIFEAFQQPHDRQQGNKGSGLGLAISKRLVNLMNGTLTVESEPEKGAKFTLCLKQVTIASAPETCAAADGRAAVSSYCFESAKILVVDDVRINRVLMIEFLKAFDFELLEAEDGVNAVALARQHRPDLILMDMVMPEMDGYDATKALKSDPELSRIPVIAVTASVMEDRRTQVFDVGCNGFVKKPVQKEEILAELARFLPLVPASEKGDANGGTVEELLANGVDEVLTPETRGRLPELLKHMDESLKPRYTQLMETMLVNDIKTFGLQVARLGENHEIKLLRKWGKMLDAEADRFDVDGMTSILKTYPHLVDCITSLLEYNHGD